MLDAFGGRTAAAPIGVVVNTHANGDHCYGNELVAGAEIIASTATAEEMAEVSPAMLAGLNAAPGEVGDLFRSFFGDFQFDGITLTPPTRTFEGRLSVDVGGREVELIEVGPAHTRGDTIVYVPDAKTVFTGDILFINGTPIVWAGPLANWVAACDLMLGMDVDVVVPGHGPLTDKAGIAAVRDYLAFVDAEATARHDAGVDAFEAAKEISALIGAGQDFARGARPGASPSTWRPCTAPSTRRTAARTSSSSSGGWPRSTTPVTCRDVAVVGDGPAGLALAAAARRVGLDASSSSARTTVDGHVRDVARRRADGARRLLPTPCCPASPSTATSATRSPGRTGSSTTTACATTSGRDRRRAPTPSGSAPCPGAALVTAAGDVDARIVVDARRGARHGRRRADRVRGGRACAGRRSRAPLLMDLRPAAGSGPPTFRYVVPVADGWLVEETVLAARPPVPPASSPSAGGPHRHPGRAAHRGRGDPRRRHAAVTERARAAVRGGRRLHPSGHRLLRRRLAPRRAARRRRPRRAGRPPRGDPRLVTTPCGRAPAAHPPAPRLRPAGAARPRPGRPGHVLRRLLRAAGGRLGALPAHRRRAARGHADDDGAAASAAAGDAAAAARRPAAWRVLTEWRTASTQPTTTAAEKMNHCTA